VSETKDNKGKILRYGELAARSARGDPTAEELAEMEEIRKELSLSADEIVAEVERVVKNAY